MTEVDARDFATFLSAFGTVRNAGVEPQPLGANRMRLPDDTDPALLSALAGIDGVTVWTDQPLPEPGSAPEASTPAADGPPTPRTKPTATKQAKRGTRTTDRQE